MIASRLVLFDIDGTLIWSDGSGRAAMQIALEQVYGTSGPIETYYFGGRTDREAVRDLMLAAGFSLQTIWSRFERLEYALEAALNERLASGEHRVRPCPGGPELVAACQTDSRLVTGLLTGNLQATAHLKLGAAGYDPDRFQLGAYGGEATDRSELVTRAVALAFDQTGKQFAGQEVVLIGDTPADVAACRAFGARSIAVLTGRHDRAEMGSAHPDSLFEDLHDTQAVLAAILTPLPESNT